jgi:hypothetical protein
MYSSLGPVKEAVTKTLDSKQGMLQSTKISS